MANNLKGYDANQVLRSVFDVDKNTLRVSIVDGGGGGGGSIEVIISHTNDSIRLGDGTNFFTSTYIGPKVGLDVAVINPVTVNGSVSVSSSVLPTNAATETTLQNLLTELQQKTEPSDNQNVQATDLDIRDLQFATDKVDVSGSTIDIGSLPSGLATEAKQDVGNTSLSSIDGKLNSLGQKTMAGSVPVVLSSDQSPLPIDLNAFSSQPDSVQLVGSLDGTSIGAKYGYVNNLRQQILATHDRIQNITYADFGTKDQRITQIAYSSPTFSGFQAIKTITYTLVGNKYRRDNIIWSVV